MRDLEQACLRAGFQPIFVEVAAASEVENAVASLVNVAQVTQCASS
jgi:hypothetical protein